MNLILSLHFLSAQMVEVVFLPRWGVLGACFRRSVKRITHLPLQNPSLIKLSFIFERGLEMTWIKLANLLGFLFSPSFSYSYFPFWFFFFFFFFEITGVVFVRIRQYALTMFFFLEISIFPLESDKVTASRIGCSFYLQMWSLYCHDCSSTIFLLALSSLFIKQVDAAKVVSIFINLTFKIKKSSGCSVLLNNFFVSENMDLRNWSWEILKYVKNSEQ